MIAASSALAARQVSRHRAGAVKRPSVFPYTLRLRGWSRQRQVVIPRRRLKEGMAIAGRDGAGGARLR